MQFGKSFRVAHVLADPKTLAWTRLKRSAGAAFRAFIGVLTILITGLSFATTANAALSASCSQVNSDFSSPRYLTNTDNFSPDYQNLTAGEYISWSFSTTGTAAGGTSSAIVIYSDNYNNLLVNESNLGGNINKSGNFTASASVDNLQIILDVTQDNSASPSNYNTLTFSAACYASAPTSPGAPTIGTATPGNSQATVSFTAPASDGGAAITSYTVTASPGGATATGSASPITVTGLTNGTAYTFTVTATNSVGTGTASAATSAVTPTVPTFTFSPASGALTAATVGTAYSETVTASGGTSPYTYAVSSGTLPAGMSLNTSTGEISGTPTTAGSASFTISATDANSATSSASYSLAVAAGLPGAPTIGTATAGNGQATVSFTAPVSNGGAAITIYTVTASPGGATATGSASPINVTGLTNGTAYTFTVTATNSVGTGTASAATSSVTPTAPTFTFSPASGALTAATVGTAYSETVTASGGTSPYTYAVTSGTLPAGMSLNTSTGAISGTPTTAANTSFTITATDANSATGSASYSLAVAADIPGAPTIGTASAGDSQATVSFTAPASDGGASITSYTVTASPGGATGTGSASPITVTGLTNGTAYTFTVTATNSAGTGTVSVASNSVTPSAVLQAPVANAVSETVAANSSANVITLNMTGGTASSVAVASVASHGTASASGTSITYTPTAGYSGSDSFTYTATNATGTSSPATVTITVTAPTLVLSPSAGTLAAGTVGAAYSQTVAVSGGAEPYDYEFLSGSLPAGLSITSSGGASARILSGTPSAAGTSNFTVKVTDAYGATITASYSITINAAAPIANALTATVTANSSDNVLAPSITGGAATAVTIASSPSHGAATVSGTNFIYTPTAGYSGSDSFTYTATNATGTSSPATVIITVTAPAFTLSPASGTLTAATVGTAYSETVTASGGTSPYTYAVTSGTLPAGMSLNTSTGVISGTPTTAANTSFTITATDANSASGSASYSLAVTEPSVTLSLSPSSGALTTATVGTAYSQSVTTTSGTAPYTYAGTGLPDGLVLDTSTGTISGTPTTAGSYAIAVTVTDSASPANHGSGNYTLTVNAAASIAFSPAGGALKEAMAGEAYSQQISATGGTGSLIYSLSSGSLPKGMVLNISTGALNGPLDAGTEGDYSFAIQARDSNGTTGTASYTVKVTTRAVTVADHVVDVPAGATPNNVYLNKDATGGPFTEADIVSVEPPEAGTATLIQGELAAVSSASPVGWYLKFTPNPAYSGQARIAYRLASSLGNSNTGTVIYNINYNAEQVATDIDNLVHSFVQTRQNMISSAIKVPGLMERGRMARATTPVTTRMSPSTQGMTFGFSTSLAQMESARDSADGVAGGYSSPFNIWIDGAVLAHNDKDTNGSKWGSFAMINMGADYLLTDKALLGLSFHYDRMTDPTDEDAMLTGNGWLAGPYTSFEVTKGVFWDASLLYGGSSNTIDTQLWDGNFDTRRWMLDTSIKGKWSLDEATVVTPKLRAVYFSETVDDYAVKNSSGDTIDLDGFTSEQFRVSLGAEIARSFTLASGSTMTPKLGITTGFSGLDGSGLFGSVTAGASLQTTEAWAIEGSLLFNIEGEGEKSVGAKVGLSRKF
ncbi:putative Ig domain-containing protein [Agrobacterium vitis]|uniref:putative Ig domain-containing protein n=1 Tax=Agrobacterium vitis TaxID=373 RepID=UPI001574A342|nr:putative Ig domain-containing protein [Agrobacterium vitis]NSZ54561.1 hemagglutinin [Agrobacterium vitis]NTA33553.1 hemagglutinin [Agrobacterium vitis]